MKLIVSDLDGTLLNSEKIVTEYTKEVIFKLRKKGIDFTLATGRGMHAVQKIADFLEIKDTVICNNGATIYSSSGKLLYEKKIDAEISEEIFKIVNGKEVEILGFYQKDIFMHPWCIKKEKPHPNHRELKVNIIGDNSCADLTLHKIIVMGKLKHISKYQEILKTRYEGKLSIAISGNNCLDIMSLGCSKGSALEILAKAKGIEMSQIMAFGDAYNDYEMLKNAGLGILMNNTHFEELKKEFPIVTKNSNDEDGVAKFLEEHFKL